MKYIFNIKNINCIFNHSELKNKYLETYKNMLFIYLNIYGWFKWCYNENKKHKL